MKKYLLLVEDESLWAKFKQTIQKDINSEIMELIRAKVASFDVSKKSEARSKK